jgi:hypothetical protein
MTLPFKSDFRLSRNPLKGQVGDEINVLMAGLCLEFEKVAGDSIPSWDLIPNPEKDY